MICKFCEQEIPDNSDFCPACLCLLENTDKALAAQAEALAKIIDLKDEEITSLSTSHSTYSTIGGVLLALFIIATFILLIYFIIAKIPSSISIPTFIALIVSEILNISLFFGIGSNQKKIKEFEKRMENIESENKKLFNKH